MAKAKKTAKKAATGKKCQFCGLLQREHHPRDLAMCNQAHDKCDEAGLAAYFKVAKNIRAAHGSSKVATDYAKADDAYERAYDRARNKMLRG